MSKAVLLSIRPQYCRLISEGKKTVEVRKTIPKMETPFKCYIYCTVGKSPKDMLTFAEYENGEYIGDYLANGKIIGEFVCDEVIEFYEETLVHDELDGSPTEGWLEWKMSDRLCEEMNLYTMEDVERCSCLKEAEFISYLLPDMHGYGWNISDLAIYDKPKELSEFHRHIEIFDGATIKELEELGILDARIKRPPQSWCYVEEV